MSDEVYWDADTLNERWKENPYIRLIDVRSPAEYESIHIEGSYNIPMNTLEQHGRAIRKNMRDPIVFVCRSGKRGKKVYDAAKADPEIQKMVASGLTHLHVLDGGIQTWQSAGGAVRRGQDRWSIERQVRFVTGAIVLLSVICSIWIPWTKWIAAFIGAGLTFAALSNTCGMELLLAQMPWNQSNQPDIDKIVTKLITDMQHA